MRVIVELTRSATTNVVDQTDLTSEEETCIKNPLISYGTNDTMQRTTLSKQNSFLGSKSLLYHIPTNDIKN